jgi:hypothetical protein
MKARGRGAALRHDETPLARASPTLQRDEAALRHPPTLSRASASPAAIQRPPHTRASLPRGHPLTDPSSRRPPRRLHQLTPPHPRCCQRRRRRRPQAAAPPPARCSCPSPGPQGSPRRAPSSRRPARRCWACGRRRDCRPGSRGRGRGPRWRRRRRVAGRCSWSTPPAGAGRRTRSAGAPCVCVRVRARVCVCVRVRACACACVCARV